MFMQNKPNQTQFKPKSNPIQTQFLYQKTVDFLAGVREDAAFRRF
jgi:hypothetical protein